MYLVGPWRILEHRFRARVWRCVATLARCVGIAALLAVTVDAPAKEPLGRLFFSTEERRTLDEMRNDDVAPQAVQPTRGETVGFPAVDVISFDGKVERTGGGRSTIWVNGRPVLTGNTTVEGVRVQSSRGTNGETRFSLPPSDAGETEFSLKVGQKVSVQSGKVLDSYEIRAAEDARSVFAAEEASAPDAGAGSDNDGQRGRDAASGARRSPVTD